MNKPFINDALVGNGRLLAAFSGKGELVRCWWPSVDFGQHVHRFRIGMATALETPVEWLDDDANGQLQYDGNTNVLCMTHVTDHGQVERTTFAAPSLDVLVSRVQLNRSGTGPAGEAPHVVVAADWHVNEYEKYQSTRMETAAGAVVHYFRDVYIAVGFLEGRPDKYRAAALPHELSVAVIDGAVSGLGSQSVIAKRATASGGACVQATVCVAFGHTLAESLDRLAQAREVGYSTLLAEAKDDAHRFLDKTAPWPGDLSSSIASLDSAQRGTLSDVARTIYARSLLTFKLLQGESGAMIAAPEFDESFSRCGGYAYCWGRDAAFIVSAMEKAGLLDEVARFYQWALKTQGDDGVWEHRHYLDGQLAPSWGLQLDETASLLWGMAKQSMTNKNNPAALRDTFPALQKAARRLLELVDPETHLMMPSVDLWEERTAEHLYSTAAASAALRAFAELCDDPIVRQSLARSTPSLDEHTLADCAAKAASGSAALAGGIQRAVSSTHGGFLRARWLSVSAKEAQALSGQGGLVREHVDEYGYSRYAASIDEVLDVSLLGLSIPFDVIPPDDERMRATAALVEARLTREVGGIGRYERDPYIGGNPWILATLWLALYKLRLGDTEGALAHFVWSIEHATSFGLLPEQVDRQTGDIAWVNPLAWSHAMYVWFVSEWSHRVPDEAAAALTATT